MTTATRTDPLAFLTDQLTELKAKGTYFRLRAGKNHEFLLPVGHLGEQERTSGLRDGLDDQHPGHDGNAGEVAGKERFIDGDILDGYDALLARQVNDSVNQ